MPIEQLSLNDLKKLFFQTRSGSTSSTQDAQVLFYKQQLGIV